MDAVRQTLRQYLGLFNAMTPSQRATLIAVPLLVGGALALLMFNGNRSSMVALSWGKVFTTDELHRAEQTLIDGGLRDYRLEGQRLMAPAAEVDRYNAALLEGGALPSNWGEERERQLKDTNIFTSDRHAQERREIALAKDLNRILRALPDIEAADIVWASEKSGRWVRNDQKVKATVNVRMRPGRQLTAERAQSLRAAVTNMVPYLNSADVVIFDVNAFRTFAPENEADPLNGKLIARIRDFERQYEQKISKALSHIDDVLVTVHVDVDNLKHWAERHQELEKETVTVYDSRRKRDETFRDQTPRAEPGAVSNQPRNLSMAGGPDKQGTTKDTTSETYGIPSYTISDREFLAAMPKAVQVSVKIPEDYYRAVALKRGLKEGSTDTERAEFQKAIDRIRQDEERKAKETAAVLIPADSPETAVEVSSFVPIDREAPTVETPLIETVRSAASQWGSAVALALFALAVLWMVKRTMPKLPETEPELPAISPFIPRRDDTDSEPEERPASPRDQLQTMVRDNPDVAASVLGKWIRAGKG